MKDSSDVWGLVPAAGSGVRYGSDVPKQLVEIAGRPVLSWAIERLLEGGLAGVTVAVAPDWIETISTRLTADRRVSFVVGGENRQASVAACLIASSAAANDLVVVHDAARPALAGQDLAAVIDAAREADGAVLGRPVIDTVKRIDSGRIVSTVDREVLFRAETPQVFRRATLEEALLAGTRDGFVGTDEASVVERLIGRRIVAVMAQRPNPKLTAAGDLLLLRSLLEQDEEAG